MKRPRLLYFVAFILLSFSSCKQKSEMNEEASADVAGVEMNSYATEKKGEAPPSEEVKEIPVQRKLIREGDMRFETDNVETTRKLIAQTVEDLKGYISKDNVTRFGENVEYNLIVRVPAGNFDLLVDKLGPGIKKLESKNINVQDVTAEFIDVEARIKTKKELETRYEELLKMAKTVEDVLNIEKEAGILRAEIESLEGRLKYLKDQVGFSTLRLDFYEQKSSPFGFGTRFGDALSNGWNFLLSFVIGLMNIWPFLLILAVSLYFIRRKFRLK